MVSRHVPSADVCVDVMLPDRTIARIPGLGGLPMNYTTSVVGTHGAAASHCIICLFQLCASLLIAPIVPWASTADDARPGVVWLGTRNGIVEYTAESGCFEQARAR